MTRSSSRRRIAKAQFRRRSSTSAASPSSRCRSRGRSRSSSHATRSRTRWTVLRCYVSASCSVASTGRSLGQSSGSWSAARRWAIQLYRLPAPAEAAASPAHTGCAQSGVSAWVARYAYVAHDERGLPVSLAAGTHIMLLRYTCHDPTPDVGLFLLPCAPVFSQAVAHVPYLTSLCPLYLPLPSHNQMQCCSTIL